MRHSGEKVRLLREESNPSNCTDGRGDTHSAYHQTPRIASPFGTFLNDRSNECRNLKS